MTSHLKKLRLQRGLTQSEVALRLGLSNHSAVSKLENGKLRLDERRLRSLASLYNVGVEELLGLSGTKTQPPGLAEGRVPYQGGERFPPIAAEAIQPVPVLVPAMHEMSRDIPVRGIAACSSGDGAFQIEHATVDYVRRPPALHGIAEAYGIYMSGDSMEPKFRSGDLVLVHPGRPVRPGDHVIIMLKDHPKSEPYAYCKRLVRRHAGKITVAQYNPSMELEFSDSAVVAVHRVLEMTDLFGV